LENLPVSVLKQGISGDVEREQTLPDCTLGAMEAGKEDAVLSPTRSSSSRPSAVPMSPCGTGRALNSAGTWFANNALLSARVRGVHSAE
jgi:hypothetical protein